jgi:hypothetical protein
VPDPAALFVSLMISTVGFALLIYGKRQRRLPQLGVGFVMLIFPYFVPGAIVPAAIAAGLLALMYLGIRMGM